MGSAQVGRRSIEHVLAPALYALIGAVRTNATRIGPDGFAAVESDTEAVHDFRVAIRRLRAVLSAARRVYGERELRAISAELREEAQAVGGLRDEEALRETLVPLTLSKANRTELVRWLLRRAWNVAPTTDDRASANAVRPAAIDPQGHSLQSTLCRLERIVAKGGGLEQASSSFAARVLSSAVRRARDRSGADAHDPEAIHALRISYKRVRYLAEVFEPVVGSRAALLAKRAARMQKQLGRIHDIDMALGAVHGDGRLPARTRAQVSWALRRARFAWSRRAKTDVEAELGLLLAIVRDA